MWMTICTSRPRLVPARFAALLRRSATALGCAVIGAGALAHAQAPASAPAAKPAAAAPAAAGKAPANADPAKGKQVFSTYCQTCHGENGDGQGPAGKALNPPPRDFTKGEFKFGDKDEDLFRTISNGAAAQKAKDGTPGSPLMAPWGSVIPEADRWAVVKYIRTFKK